LCRAGRSHCQPSYCVLSHDVVNRGGQRLPKDCQTSAGALLEICVRRTLRPGIPRQGLGPPTPTLPAPAPPGVRSRARMRRGLVRVVDEVAGAISCASLEVCARRSAGLICRWDGHRQTLRSAAREISVAMSSPRSGAAVFDRLSRVDVGSDPTHQREVD
jgi:hypothetical protein